MQPALVVGICLGRALAIAAGVRGIVAPTAALACVAGILVLAATRSLAGTARHAPARLWPSLARFGAARVAKRRNRPTFPFPTHQRVVWHHSSYLVREPRVRHYAGPN
jgi:hypothetical protein